MANTRLSRSTEYRRYVSDHAISEEVRTETTSTHEKRVHTERRPSTTINSLHSNCLQRHTHVQHSCARYLGKPSGGPGC